MAGLFANNGKPLGKLRGVFFTNGENRNDYPCDDTAAKNAASDELATEKIVTGGIIGRVDHTNHNPDTNPNDETLVKESAVNMRRFPKRNNKGEYIGECVILDTPDGQKVYAYCKSGKKPGVSYRGGIDQDAYERGDIDAAWKQFTVEGFDIVLVPAYRECYLELVEDYIDTESECYVKFKTEYLDKNAPIERNKSMKHTAGLDAKGAARAMLKVSASKQGAKEMAKVMAQEKHFTEAEALEINKAIDEQNIDGNRRTKEQAKEIGTPYDASPKHTWSRQEGNGTIDMHHEEGIYGEEDIDPLTGKKIETLNTGNKSEKDIPVVGKQTEEQKRQAEASIEKKIKSLAEETADELVAEEIKKKTAAGVEKGTVADKELEEDEELEGYLDKDGKVIKTTAGVLGVQSEEETPEEKEKKGEIDKDGKVIKTKEKKVQKEKSAITSTRASVLGVKAEEDEEPEVEILTEDGIKELGSEIVKDESEEDNSDDGTIQTLVEEITKLTEEIVSLKEMLKSKDEEVSNRNSELDNLTASYKRLKRTVACAVDKAKAVETVQADNSDLQERNTNLAQVIAQLKTKHKAVIAELRVETDDYKKVIAGYERETDIRNRSMSVQANAMRRQSMDNKVLAGRNDNLGKLCVGMVSEMLGIDEGKLLAKRGEIKNKAQLEKVIASLQKPRRTISASYYPITEGMRNALPTEIQDACEKVDWNEEENF